MLNPEEVSERLLDAFEKVAPFASPLAELLPANFSGDMSKTATCLEELNVQLDPLEMHVLFMLVSLVYAQSVAGPDPTHEKSKALLKFSVLALSAVMDAEAELRQERHPVTSRENR